MRTLNQFALLLLGAYSLLAQVATAAEVSNAKGGMLDFNLYPYLSDVSNDSSFTLNMATNLPNRISYFGFINLTNQADRSELGDLNGYYTEQNLRWQMRENSAFDATLQYNTKTGDNNDKLRLGVRWRLSDSDWLKPVFSAISLKWSVNLHAIQFDHDDKTAWQIEHAFYLGFPYLTDRLYLAGFIDQNRNETVAANVPPNPVVAEAQLGFRLVDNLYAIAEYRVNQYRRSDVNNLAVGVEYKMKW
jgi:opacity protein-like surface antigen